MGFNNLRMLLLRDVSTLKVVATEHNRCPKVNCSGAFCETTAAGALLTKEVEEWASTI